MDVRADRVSAGGGLLARIAQGLRDPAGSSAAALAARPSELALLTLIVVAAFFGFLGRSAEYLIQATGGDPVPTPAAMRDRLSALLVETLAAGALGVYGLSVIARVVGRAFGGVGSWSACRVACAWGALLSAPVMLVSKAAAMTADSASGVVGSAALQGLALASALYAIYLWSGAVAAAHVADDPVDRAHRQVFVAMCVIFLVAKLASVWLV